MMNGLIIPCFNESDRLDIKSFVAYATENKHNMLCFVNDGSSDATRSTLAEIKNLEHENVIVYNVSKNCGKAKAVQLGALHLYEHTELETIGFIDADLSTDFDDYDKLIYHMKVNKSLKVIYGSRTNDGKNKIERDLIRGIISQVIRHIILCITRLKIQDTQCGAKIFRRDIIPYVFNSEFKTRWLFDVEILLRLKKHFSLKRFREIFLEKPLDNWVHMDGSKLGMKDAIKIPLSLLRIGWIYNIKDPINRGVIEHMKTMTLNVKGLKVFQVSMFLLSLTLLSIAITDEIKMGNPLNLFLIVSIVIYLIASLRSIFKRFSVNQSRRWRWAKGYFNSYMRKLLVND